VKAVDLVMMPREGQLSTSRAEHLKSPEPPRGDLYEHCITLSGQLRGVTTVITPEMVFTEITFELRGIESS